MYERPPPLELDSQVSNEAILIILRGLFTWLNDAAQFIRNVSFGDLFNFAFFVVSSTAAAVGQIYIISLFRLSFAKYGHLNIRGDRRTLISQIYYCHESGRRGS